ncbi:hypothetical protein [Antarcticirhabdus aurantiaca]|uniref:Uncharacterized protein n=1 Tax=Antarcticirhabdus aurantiaca TaxID=2606717 RepID=A0ACD4NUP1_9HYPH|nr:hypothetical protein [Antarcticirhabdus aurantiaca]WAJ30512.1 hypothetical protein OXU80_10035 [Jeongeuplla avenae]
MADEEQSSEAARASAVVEAWLAARGSRPPLDTAVLVELRLALARVCEAEIVGRDPMAQRILRNMAWAEDMDEFHAALDRLSARVAELTSGARHETAAPRPPRRLLRL